MIIQLDDSVRILVLSFAPPRTDGATMGIQQTFHRLRQLTAEHAITVAYTNPTHEPEPQQSEAVPFALVKLPSPQLAESIAPASRSRAFWIFNAWQHALLDPVPKPFQQRGGDELRRAISDLITAADADVVHVVGEPMMYALPPDTPRLLADFPDLYSNLYRRIPPLSTRRAHRFQHAREIGKIEQFERRVMRRAALALFVSESDRQAAAQLAPQTPTALIPNAADVDYFAPAPVASEPNSLLFSGTLAYRPNIQAAQFLVREILPRIRAVVPDVTLNIVGYKPDASVLALANEFVHVHANVPDMRPYMARAAVCVVPLLNGSGTRIKIIEAWLMGKAIVSTRIGAEGLDAVSGEQLLLADEPDEFAAAVVSLLQNNTLRAKLGQTGRALALERYSLTAAARQLDAAYHRVANAAVETPSR